MTDLNAIPSHSHAVVSRKTGDEFILVPLTDNIADMNSVYTLNETGAFIWENIDGKKTIRELIGMIVAEYDISAEQAQADMFDFINELSSYLVISS